MTAGSSATRFISNHELVDMSAQNLTSEATRLCFAPPEQGYNHGSDRMRPLRTMPFDSETWIGNFEDLGSRVWPHPSFKELLARSLTGNPKFPLPDTVAKESRFQNPRLRCCGSSCCPTTHSPFVEYERPSRLETLAFERTQNVVIYPFYVQLSKRTGLQKLFAIVHRHKDGEYKFWRADGTYHESFGLVKGSISIFQSPKSTHSSSVGSPSSLNGQLTSTPTKSGGSAAQLVDDLDDTPLRIIQKARALNRNRTMGTQLVNNLDVEHFRKSPETPSKRRAIADSSLAQSGGNGNEKTPYTATSRASATPGTLRVRGHSRTPTEQSSHPGVLKFPYTLLQVRKVCMLAYHLTDLKLMYRTNAFTIESNAQRSLLDPTTGCPFLIDEQHAQYVLSSSQKSLKVILSKDTTWSVSESHGKTTGGIILLDFGGTSARDEFITRISDMVGMTEGRIGCADDLVIESMYSKLLKQFDECRMAMYDAQSDNETRSQESPEITQSFPEEISSEVDKAKAVFCPPSLTETSSCHISATSRASQPATPSMALMSEELPQSRLPTAVSASASISQPITATPIDPPSTQSQQTTTAVRLEPKVATSEMAMKRELLHLLREVYIKYPSAQNDDHVEEMALLLKAPLLAGETERVRELKMDLKVYLIAHHG